MATKITAPNGWTITFITLNGRDCFRVRGPGWAEPRYYSLKQLKATLKAEVGEEELTAYPVPEMKYYVYCREPYRVGPRLDRAWAEELARQLNEEAAGRGGMTLTPCRHEHVVQAFPIDAKVRTGENTEGYRPMTAGPYCVECGESVLLDPDVRKAADGLAHYACRPERDDDPTEITFEVTIYVAGDGPDPNEGDLFTLIQEACADERLTGVVDLSVTRCNP